MKAMILAAGYGTRLKPFTDHHPKALAIVNGKSLLQRNIEYLAGFGIKDIIVNVHHFAEQVQAALQINKGWGSNVVLSDESDAILETGGGLKRVAWFFEDSSEPFVLMNVDILTDLDLRRMIQQHLEIRPLATLAVTKRETSRYFLFNKHGILSGWKNVKTGEEKISRVSQTYIQKAFSGIHVIDPEIYSLIKQEGKFSMVDAYLDLAKDQTIIAFDHSNGKLQDVGKPESIIAAEKLFF